MQAWSTVPVPRVPGAAWPLQLFNTATAQLEPVTAASMYVCGITPYDATHLGHAATYLAFDLVYRQWLDQGFQVRYAQNVTDVDDPLLDRAIRDGIDWVVLAQRETELFRNDMTALRVLPPTDFVSATEAMPEIVEAIAKLLASGAAYRVDDPDYPDIYFDHSAAEHFGSVSGYAEPTMRALFAERGGDPDRIGKKHPLDPLLWRAARAGEPAWDGELGIGRPGWHIECTAIALDRLGASFSVQGGGADLIFPHHEFSAAHAEALTGRHPFAQHYVHTGMIGLDGEKMSKSQGNLVLVSQLTADGVDPMVIRLALLAEHYRADRDWASELLRSAQQRLARWQAAIRLLAGPEARPVIDQLRQCLAQDLNTPEALNVIDTWAADALAQPGRVLEAPEQVRSAVDALLGIKL